MLTLLPSLPGGPIAALKLGFFLPGPSTLTHTVLSKLIHGHRLGDPTLVGQNFPP